MTGPQAAVVYPSPNDYVSIAQVLSSASGTPPAHPGAVPATLAADSLSVQPRDPQNDRKERQMIYKTLPVRPPAGVQPGPVHCTEPLGHCLCIQSTQFAPPSPIPVSRSSPSYFARRPRATARVCCSNCTCHACQSSEWSPAVATCRLRIFFSTFSTWRLNCLASAYILSILSALVLLKGPGALDLTCTADNTLKHAVFCLRVCNSFGGTQPLPLKGNFAGAEAPKVVLSK